MLCPVREEAESFVVGGIADKQDSAMATVLGFLDRRSHQHAADTFALMRRIHGKRAEQQRRHGLPLTVDAGFDVPETHGADYVPVGIASDKGQPFGGHTAAAQLLRRFPAATGTHGAVEQVLARDDVARSLRVDNKGGWREKRAQGINNSGHRGLPSSKPLQADRT
ncbi:hypothetical protein EMEDMD4_320029 [Sinorhizobium medicae]|uniref:Uncharacterized protein n=1 Tax=Sinorhizobium medicae TaxID=110321 RepID=A0A508WX15_9HYPH|nr:hypothetical protein EMEDMD4_320029 [Sinorhizobium medicae]